MFTTDPRFKIWLAFEDLVEGNTSSSVPRQILSTPAIDLALLNERYTAHPISMLLDSLATIFARESEFSDQKMCNTIAKFIYSKSSSLKREDRENKEKVHDLFLDELMRWTRKKIIAERKSSSGAAAAAASPSTASTTLKMLTPTAPDLRKMFSLLASPLSLTRAAAAAPSGSSPSWTEIPRIFDRAPEYLKATDLERFEQYEQLKERDEVFFQRYQYEPGAEVIYKVCVADNGRSSYLVRLTRASRDKVIETAQRIDLGGEFLRDANDGMKEPRVISGKVTQVLVRSEYGRVVIEVVLNIDAQIRRTMQARAAKGLGDPVVNDSRVAGAGVAANTTAIASSSLSCASLVSSAPPPRSDDDSEHSSGMRLSSQRP